MEECAPKHGLAAAVGRPRLLTACLQTLIDLRRCSVVARYDKATQAYLVPPSSPSQRYQSYLFLPVVACHEPHFLHNLCDSNSNTEEQTANHVMIVQCGGLSSCRFGDEIQKTQRQLQCQNGVTRATRQRRLVEACAIIRRKGDRHLKTELDIPEKTLAERNRTRNNIQPVNWIVWPIANVAALESPVLGRLVGTLKFKIHGGHREMSVVREERYPLYGAEGRRGAHCVQLHHRALSAVSPHIAPDNHQLLCSPRVN